jgi:hypothetical protein
MLRRPQRLAAFALFALAAACGQRPAATSQLAQRNDVPTTGARVTAADDFLTHANAIVAAGSGHLETREIFAVVPLEDAGLASIVTNYPNGFAVACDAGVCKLDGSGTPLEAQMRATIGPVQDPKLGLRAKLTARFVLRGPDAVEVCGVSGMYVHKLFVTQEVQGLYVSRRDNGTAATLTVNTAGSDDFTCQ